MAAMRLASHWRLGAFGAVALLLAACGSGDSTDAVATQPAPTAALTQAPAQAPLPPPLAAATEAPAEQGPLRADGLTGAPVPVPEGQSAAFDVERLNVRAGAFPPLDHPEVVSRDEAWWLKPETLVLGALNNGEARAYPITMMQFHHVANDELGGAPYLVTF